MDRKKVGDVMLGGRQGLDMCLCLILKLTFVTDGLSFPNITVVRANGKMKMKDVINVDAREEGVFKITDTGIEYMS